MKCINSYDLIAAQFTNHYIIESLLLVNRIYYQATAGDKIYN